MCVSVCVCVQTLDNIPRQVEMSTQQHVHSEAQLPVPLVPNGRTLLLGLAL